MYGTRNRRVFGSSRQSESKVNLNIYMATMQMRYDLFIAISSATQEPTKGSPVREEGINYELIRGWLDTLDLQALRF